MDSSNPHKSDPLILLLNEIEISLSQMGLMELYFKQAQAAAASEAAQFHERYQSELAGLRAELSEKERTLAENRLELRAKYDQLQSQIQDLQTRSEELQRLLVNREVELLPLRSEVASLRTRIAQLESANNEALVAAQDSERSRQILQSELAGLYQELGQKNLVLQRYQVAARELESDLHNQLHRLQDELAEGQASLASKDSELERAAAEIAQLRQRIVELDTSRNDAQAAPAQELENARTVFEDRLAELQAALTQKDQVLQERDAAIAAIELRLHTQIQDLTSQLEQKQELLAGRDGELGALRDQLAQTRGLLAGRDSELQNTQSELAALRERLSQLEAARSDAETSASRAAEAMRIRFETELGGLHTTLAEKERILNERETEYHGALRDRAAEMDGLRVTLAEEQALLDTRNVELQQARSEAAALQERANELDFLQKQTERLLSAQAEQLRRRVRTELEDLDARLKNKDQELQAAQAKARELQESQHAKISELQLQLAEKQLLLEGRTNEVDDLKAGVNRLSEQVARLESAARAAEVNATAAAEQQRSADQAELMSLREELRQKQQALAQQDAQARELERNLGAQIVDLQGHFAAKQQILESREHALETANHELTALQARLIELEASSREERNAAASETARLRQGLEAELANLRSELQHKDWAIAERQAALENLAEDHKSHIRNLEAKLAAQQRSTESRGAEFEKAKSEAAALQQRIIQLETAARHAEVTAASRTEQMAQLYETQVAALRTELEQKTTALQERGTTWGYQEQTHQEEVERLRMEAQEKHALLENRNEELVGVKSELDLLRERFTQLESAARRAEEAAASESERMRTEHQAQLERLQAELGEKDWGMEKRQATVNGLEQDVIAPIQAPQSQREEKQALRASHKNEFVLGEPKMTDEQKERYAELQNLLEKVKTDEGETFPAKGGRWRSFGSWKRRWKL